MSEARRIFIALWSALIVAAGLRALSSFEGFEIFRLPVIVIISSISACLFYVASFLNGGGK